MLEPKILLPILDSSSSCQVGMLPSSPTSIAPIFRKAEKGGKNLAHYVTIVDTDSKVFAWLGLVLRSQLSRKNKTLFYSPSQRHDVSMLHYPR